MKIKVCIPFYLDYKAAFPGCEELVHCKKHFFSISTAQGPIPAASRNKLVSTSQKKTQTDFADWDYFLFVDSDIKFTAQHALNLIEKDVDIVSGAYVRQDNPDLLNCGLWDDNTPGNISSHFATGSDGFRKVDYVGAGFLLVKKEVFSKIEYPWFRHFVVEKDGCQEELAEDYGFCMGAWKADIDIYVDCDTLVEHVLRVPEQHRILPGLEALPPPSIAQEVLLVAETMGKWSRRYSELYAEILRMRQ